MKTSNWLIKPEDSETYIREIVNIILLILPHNAQVEYS